jgi:hypothetical protein
VPSSGSGGSLAWRPPSRSAREDSYWHFALHALAVIAFLAHVSTADASFFGFAAEAILRRGPTGGP